jgi:hypothetical protein
MSLGVGMGVGQFGWEQSGGYPHQVLRLFAGVCAEGARINRRLPPLRDTLEAGWLSALGVSLPCSQGASPTSSFASSWLRD